MVAGGFTGFEISWLKTLLLSPDILIQCIMQTRTDVQLGIHKTVQRQP